MKCSMWRAAPVGSPLLWLVASMLAVWLLLPTRRPTVQSAGMATVTKSKKTARTRKPTARSAPRSRVDSRFCGLVRSPVTGLLVTPLKPGQKPVSVTTINKALADSL